VFALDPSSIEPVPRIIVMLCKMFLPANRVLAYALRIVRALYEQFFLILPALPEKKSS
jgi:hypothetical protein